MTASIIVNEAHYGPENPLHDLQAQAMGINLPRLPSWAQLIRRKVTCEGGTLKCSCADIGGARHLPYIRQMLEVAEATGDTWIGIMNSDIILTPRFFTRLTQVRQDVVLTHRWKTAPSHIALPEAYGSVETNCTDMILFRRDLWGAFDLPDFVLGEPYWDLAAVAWAKKHLHALFDSGECLHADHKGTWRSGFSRTRVHNLNLYVDYMRKRDLPIEDYIAKQWRLFQLKKMMRGGRR